MFFKISSSNCRFPTAANVELARLAKEQRIKRGERLEASKSRFETGKIANGREEDPREITKFVSIRKTRKRDVPKGKPMKRRKNVLVLIKQTKL